MLVATALVGIVNQRGEDSLEQPPLLYPKVLNNLRPPQWPESFPSLNNLALIQSDLQSGKSWLFTSPGEYLATTLTLTDQFKKAGFTGPRAISATDSTYIGIRKIGDRVVIRIDELKTKKIPDGWLVIRITYIQAPTDHDELTLSRQT